jgi:hypothetical protein
MCDYWANRYEERSPSERSCLKAPLAKEGTRLLDLDLNRILLWLFARAVEASPYWGGMADLAQTLYPLLT